MSIETLMDEVKSLDPSDRRKLMAFLVALQDSNNEAYRESLAEKIDDESPERWLTIDEVEERLRETGRG